jgi:Uma2 family endonuclease
MSTATLAETAPERGNKHDQFPMETDEALYELVNGKRVEMPAMSIRAGMIANELVSELNAFAKPKRLGKAFTEILVRLPLAEDLNRDRRPDGSFFSYSQLATEFFQDPEENALELIPELPIEVTSPTDRAENQREKVLEYFLADASWCASLDNLEKSGMANEGCRTTSWRTNWRPLRNIFGPGSVAFGWSILAFNSSTCMNRRRVFES